MDGRRSQQLGVVSIQMIAQWDEFLDVFRIRCELGRSDDRSPRYPETQWYGDRCRGDTVHLGPPSKIGMEPIQHIVTASKALIQDVQKYTMIYSIKSSTKIQKDQSTDVTIIYCTSNVIVDDCYCSLSRMVWPVGRLELRQQTMI